MKQIDIGITKIKSIYHIGDVHIRTLKRHKEYRQVFRRLFKQIRDTKSPDDVIYLAGDIVHSKLDLSPECIDLVQWFFKNLADLAPTILIAGNHDCNLNNTYRLDALSPIVKALNHPNLHYLKNSGIYQMGGIDWVVMSVWDAPSEFIKAKDVPGSYKIALHHGAVNRAQTDIGYTITNDHVMVDIFDGYDLALLGDIHRRQYLDNPQEVEMEIDEDDLQKYLDEGWEIVE